MFPFLKGAIGGAVLAWLVSTLIVQAGSHATWLDVRSHTVEGVRFAWSWTLFLGGTGLLSWAFLLVG